MRVKVRADIPHGCLAEFLAKRPFPYEGLGVLHGSGEYLFHFYLVSSFLFDVLLVSP